ncbi:TonB system biopolymer transport component; Chromosome segregation ATPase [hydrothermal vent metagenome]|uniref:TonB system biopolymer transport component Chromosome segregation ATPase n=1 Tax=hydrothermal vent metagenome TaxID=652676 RepID=A0A3B0SUX5_9ZZZZ
MMYDSPDIKGSFFVAVVCSCRKFSKNLLCSLNAMSNGMNFNNSKKAVGRRMIKHRVRTVVLSAVAATSLVWGAGSAGATDLNQVLEVGIKANQVAQQSQEKINKTVDQTDKIIGDYKAVLRTIEGLRIYNAQLQRQIDLQVVEMGKLTKSIKGVTYVKRQITPLMMKMVDALGEFIEKDLPIKREERIAGIERLRELMDNPNVDASEKFRSVFELYQIESEYGRAVQAYTDKVIIGGNELEVDMLHIGRIALVYQTRDGVESGMWDHAAEEWVPLDESYRKPIKKALAVAQKKAAADTLLRLPLTAPIPGKMETAK